MKTALLARLVTQPLSPTPGVNTAQVWGRRILFGSLLLVPLFFWRGSIDAFDFQKFLLLKLTLIALAGVWLWQSHRAVDWRRVRAACCEPITLGFLLFWGSACLSTLTSINPWISWQGAYFSYAGLGTVTAFTFLFLASRWLIHTEQQAEALLRAAVLAGTVAAGYAVVQGLGLDPLAWSAAQFGDFSRAFGTLGHANLLAAYLAMTFPLTVYLACSGWAQGQKRLAMLLAGAAILMVVALLLTLCRGGWLATLATLPLLALGLRWRGKVWKYSLGCGLGTAALLVVLILGGPASFRQSFTERWQRFSEPSGRFELWQAAWQIFQEHPLTGSGLETFALTFPAHRSLAYWRFEGGLTHHRAHSEPIHILATQGVLGIAAWLLILGGLVRAVWRLGRTTEPSRRLFPLALGAALLAFYVQNLFFFTMIAYGSLVVILAAVVSNLSVRRSSIPEMMESTATMAPPTRGQGAFRWAGLGCLGVVLWLTVLQPWRADALAAEGLSWSRADDSRQALPSLQQALAVQPGQTYFLALWGEAAEKAGLAEPRSGQRHAYWRQALDAYETAGKFVPQNAEYQAGRARVLGQMAREGLVEPRLALAAYDDALRRDPNHVQRYVDASRIALEMGAIVEAERFVRRGLERAPRYGPLHAQQAVTALRTGQVAEAFAILEDLYRYDWTGETAGFQSARCAKAEALLRLGRPAEALSITQSLLQAGPTWTAPQYLGALALEALGRGPEARRYYEEILRREPHHGPAARRLQQVREQTK